MTHDEYIEALKRHDWHFEWSSEHSAWQRGKAEREALRAARNKLDPDFKTWDQFAPRQYRKGSAA